MDIRKFFVPLQQVKDMTDRPGGFRVSKNKMKRIYIFDVFTKQDITACVTLAIGKGGKVHVFNAFGVDITENVFFGLE